MQLAAKYFSLPRESFSPCRRTKPSSFFGIPMWSLDMSGEEIKIKDLPDMQIAVTKFAGPAEDYPKAYHEVANGVEENGYCWDGAPIEVYSKKPKVKDGKTIMYSEIQVPVKPK